MPRFFYLDFLRCLLNHAVALEWSTIADQQMRYSEQRDDDDDDYHDGLVVGDNE